uniref:Uncharacterized protein n=1 Tax=Romanomermis culicivorax TaxID=13658 RepID=A0A915L5S5_ROMCU
MELNSLYHRKIAQFVRDNGVDKLQAFKKMDFRWMEVQNLLWKWVNNINNSTIIPLRRFWPILSQSFALTSILVPLDFPGKRQKCLFSIQNPQQCEVNLITMRNIN